MLTEHDAMNIYEIKIACTQQMSKEDRACRSLRGQSGPVSKLFGVSPRAIRDIWNRRTWAYVTKRLWSLESLPQDSDTSCHNDSSTSSIRVLLCRDCHSTSLNASKIYVLIQCSTGNEAQILDCFEHRSRLKPNRSHCIFRSKWKYLGNRFRMARFFDVHS